MARPCSCRACNIALRGAGRRATTAVWRRKPSLAEILTACYSTVVTSAVLANALRKDRRRDELDEQLDSARHALSELRNAGNQETEETQEHDVQSLDVNMPDISIDQMIPLWASLKRIWLSRPYMKELHVPATASASELVQGLKRRLYHCPAEKSTHITRQTDYETFHRFSLAEELDTSVIGREVKTDRHLNLESRAVEHVVCQLLHRASRIQTYIRPGQNPSFYEAKELVLRSGMDYTYPIIDRDRWRQNKTILNKCLRDIIAMRNISLREKIGRVCYDLIVSAYAPDIHNYNTLIVAFDRAGLFTFSEVLINSFFYERLLQPTALTYVAILNHYKVVGNHGRFLMAIARIAGCDSQVGGKVARRHIEDCTTDGIPNAWAADTDLRTQNEEWVFEHVPLNRAIVAEMITGLIHFQMFHQAVYLFFACVELEIFLSTAVVKRLLDGCLAALDWRGALEVVYGLTTYNRSWKAFLLTGDVATDWYLINRIYTLLDLCGLRHGPRKVSEEYLDELGIPPERLAGLLTDLELHEQWLYRPCFPANAKGEPSVVGAQSRLMQLESIWKDYVCVRNTTKSIESKLLYPDFSLEFRISMAHHIGGAALDDASQLVVEVEDMLSSIVGFGPWLFPLDWDRRMEARKRYLRRAGEAVGYKAATRLDVPSSEAIGSPSMGSEEELASRLRTLRREVDQRRPEPGPFAQGIHERHDSAEPLSDVVGRQPKSTERSSKGTTLALVVREQHWLMVPAPEGSRLLDIVRARYGLPKSLREGVLRRIQGKHGPTESGSLLPRPRRERSDLGLMARQSSRTEEEKVTAWQPMARWRKSDGPSMRNTPLATKVAQEPRRQTWKPGVATTRVSRGATETNGAESFVEQLEALWGPTADASRKRKPQPPLSAVESGIGSRDAALSHLERWRRMSAEPLGEDEKADMTTAVKSSRDVAASQLKAPESQLTQASSYRNNTVDIDACKRGRQKAINRARLRRQAAESSHKDKSPAQDHVSAAVEGTRTNEAEEAMAWQLKLSRHPEAKPLRKSCKGKPDSPAPADVTKTLQAAGETKGKAKAVGRQSNGAKTISEESRRQSNSK
ncbi:hypothetical protein XA68_17569 [Ophiocordyceps unilateralis]|uniref:Uncharacterized protein n=1 Tax=Ophiocordyceps unilateralis TaxID=268505 RepID=A0A2A9P2V7_OPHUN|nr:hypothetical protein XA68_17569 [Ophiocordyceps unilateralis]